MRRVLVAISLLCVFLLTPWALFSLQPRWFTDSRTGCRVLSEPKFDLSNISMEWVGQCDEEKKAIGSGTLRWFSDGIIFLTEEIGEAKATQMVSGAVNSVVSASAIQLSVIECKPENANAGTFNSYRLIRADVPAGFNLGEWVVVSHILSLTERYAWERCPSVLTLLHEPDLAGVAPRIYQDGELRVTAVSYPKDALMGRGETYWGEYQNNVVDEQRRSARMAVSTVQQQRRDAERLARKQEAETKAGVARNRAAEFAKKNQVHAWLSIDRLTVNPFIYQGKVIAVQTTFWQMIAPDRGLFGGDLVVSGLPNHLFRSRVRVILAGQVLGSIPLQSRGREGVVPHLLFVDVYICKESYCEDMSR